MSEGTKLYNLPALLVVVFSVLMPIAVLPGSNIYSVKVGLLIIADFLLLCFFARAWFLGRTSFVRIKFVVPLLLMPIWLSISSVFSGSFDNSFFGNMVEIGSSSSFILLTFLFVGAIHAFSTKRPYGLLVKAYLVSSCITLIHFFVIVLINNGWLKAIEGFPVVLVGGYVDLSVILGLAILVSLFILDFGEPSFKLKFFLRSFIFTCVFIVGILGFVSTLWSMIVVLLLNFFFSKKFSKTVIAAFLLCFIFAIGGSKISGPLTTVLKINSIDVRPSISATTSIIVNQWKDNFITGSGANRFSKLWSLYKPVSINTTNFWAQDFVFGSSLALTLIVTGGAGAALLMATFVFYYIKAGFGIRRLEIEPKEKILLWYAFLIPLYLWIFVFVYNPGITILSFAFISLAFFASLLASAESAYSWKPEFVSKKSKSAFIVAVTILLGIFAYSSYFSWLKIRAANAFSKAIESYSRNNDLAQAEKNILNVISIAETDLYFRTLVNVYKLDIENKIKSLKSTSSKEEKKVIQDEISVALSLAKRAVAYDGSNYLNHFAEAELYESLAYYQVGGALGSSQNSYMETQKRNPTNPAVQLGLARLAALKGDVALAKQLVSESIALKPNYSAAHYFSAQLEASTNNIVAAISNVEKAAVSEPGNVGLYFQLGLLKYNAKDYKGAITSFNKSIQLVPEYANARYFLGLSYYYSGSREEAMRQFQEVLKTNPDNVEIKLVLENLLAGREPFEDAKSPLDSKPENRKNPPVEE